MSILHVFADIEYTPDCSSWTEVAVVSAFLPAAGIRAGL
jgi:hypothetical protein